MLSRSVGARVPIFSPRTISACLVAAGAAFIIVRAVPGTRNQEYLLAAAALIAIALRYPKLCAMAVLPSVAFIGLVRRLAGGASAHVANDPLIAAPLLLLIPLIVTGYPIAVGSHPAKVLTSAILITALADFLLIPSDTSFLVGARALAFLMIPGLAFLALSRPGNFAVVDIALTAGRWATLVAGIYGIFQYFVTPFWDLNWLTSQIPYNSAFGNPVPGQFRLFGPTESPLSYAALLGVGLILWIARPGNAPTKVLVVACLAFPLLLTAVRTSVFALAVVLGVWVLRARSRQVVLVVSLLVVVSVIAYFGVTAVRPDLTGRFAVTDLGTDTSVRARSSLLGADFLKAFFSAGKGLGSSTNGTYVTDNGYLAAFIEGGFPGGILFGLGVISVLMYSATQVRGKYGDSLFLVMLFLALCEASAPVLQGDTGLFFWLAGAASFGARAVAQIQHSGAAQPLKLSGQQNLIVVTRTR